MANTTVNPDYVIKNLFAKVNQLTSNEIVKDAYIQQLEEELKKLKETTENK
jgi:hypothetical protein